MNRPPVHLVGKFGAGIIARDAVLILAVFIIRMVMVLAGLLIVAVALPWSYTEGYTNLAGWQMRKLPRWAWLWSNDHDGIEGDTEGRYQVRDGYGFGWWPRYNWAALRNPANNFSRHVIGFHFGKVERIEWNGSRPDADDDRIGWTYNRALVGGLWLPGWTWTTRRWCWSFGWKIRHSRPSWKAQIGFTTTIGPYKP